MTGLPGPVGARPDVSTSSASRATRQPPKKQPGPSLTPLRACFIPETLMGFHLQGFDPPRDRDRITAAASFHVVSKPYSAGGSTSKA